MVVKSEQLAKKYAKAYLNIFGGNITLREIIGFGEFIQTFNSNINILESLAVIDVSHEKLVHFLTNFCKHYKVHLSLCSLIMVLLKHKRVSIFVRIIQQIIKEFRLRNNIVKFQVKSSHILSSYDQQEVIKFLERETGSAVETCFVQNEELIWGIKMESDFIVFEHSVSKELREIEHILLQRVKL